MLNGLTLALAFGFLIIVLWNDLRKELNQFFAIFLILVMLWIAGAFLAQAVALVLPDSPLIGVMISIMELGFTGSSVAIYALTTILVRSFSRRFRYLAFASLLVVIGYRVLLIVSGAPIPYEVVDGVFTLQTQPLLVIFYLIFDMATVYLVIRYHRKIRSRQLSAGILLFVGAQSIGFLNPELQTFTLSLIIGSVAALVLSFAILRQEILTPLVEHVSQVEAMHRVSLAITSELALDTVLREIATQAADWLDADAAGIFLRAGDSFTLEAVYELPREFIGLRLSLGEGVVGKVAQTQQSMLIDHYARDWKGIADLPYARESFGAVICAPLIYTGSVIGVLMVIAGRHGRLFRREDVRLLDFLGAQAAVAIKHGRYFEQLTDLAQQRETLLNSTDNPVIAFDRGLKLIFSNPAAQALLEQPGKAEGVTILDILPAAALPKDYLTVARSLRRGHTYTYDVSLNGHDYLCQIARFGQDRSSGWVAILNDVTQLKELDRLKSEMLRMTSHDLKNPLQAAMANLDLLRDDLADVATAEMETSVDTIDAQLLRMHRIISGILDVERVRSGIMRREVCSPLRVVTHTLDEMRHFAQQHDIALSMSVAEHVPNFTGDYDQFQRALINLVENAIKFTPVGGKVSINAYHDADRVIFRVEDSGIGIPEALHERIFERFFRGRQTGYDHISGSGLGLSLVKAVAENHGGSVWVESTVGVGSVFYLSVPAALHTEPMDAI
jgi:signal transduction histidine kinase